MARRRTELPRSGSDGRRYLVAAVSSPRGDKVRGLLSTAIVLCATAAALGRPAPAPQIHPAVVRVIVPERGGASLGSGALVAINERHGLVVTNYHVVRDGNGPAGVVFPDGFRSGARVVRVDRDWDLAALVIWRPNVRPVSLAAEPPRLGETLSIAGYGKGSYRIATGRATQYVSPGGSLPYEMIELSAGARQGDSGGPIFNQQGELAGVLFGSAWGKTVGSHSRRVRQFLAPILVDFDRMEADERTMIAQRPTVTSPASTRSTLPTATIPAASRRPTADTPSGLNDGWTASSREPWTPPEMPAVEGGSPVAPAALPGPSLLDQAKTILAAIGLLALFFHAIRLLGAG